MQKKAIAFAAAACSLALALGGCGGQGGNGDAADGEMIMNVYGCEPQHPLIPANTNETCGGNPIDMLFAKLVTFDDKGNAQNEVAKEIVANEDSSEYTITLNDGWTFTDGTPVTSESFTKAWSYSANAANGMVNASFFSVIEGYEDLQDPEGDPNAQLSGLTVVDDTTFTVKLTGPNSTFPPTPRCRSRSTTIRRPSARARSATASTSSRSGTTTRTSRWSRTPITRVLPRPRTMV